MEILKSAGKDNQYPADTPRVKQSREFIGQDTAFPYITPVMLYRLKAYIKSTRNLSERNAVNALVMVRSVFSYAIKNNIVEPKCYPFGKGKIKIKFPDAKRPD